MLEAIIYNSSVEMKSNILNNLKTDPAPRPLKKIPESREKSEIRGSEIVTFYFQV